MELSGSRSLPQLSYGRTHLLSSSSSSSSSTQEKCSESPMEGEGCLEEKKSINVIWGRGINEKGKCVMKVRSRSSSFDEPDYCSSRDQSIFNCYSIYERQSEEIEKTSLNKMVEEIEAFELASGDSSNIFHNSKGSEVEAIGKLWQSSEGESSGGLKKNTASGSFQGEFTGREARRNNIRRLWDALFHRSPSLEVSVNDGLNNLGFEDSRRPFNHNMGQSGSSLEEGRNRFMVWAFQRRSKVSVKESCPSRCHSNGQCNCETYVVVEETNTGTLLSRIANLVKILSQVLDEILCESATIAWLPSFSLGPLPAPDLIVNSLPVHIHKNPPGANQDDGQCYICFSDYIDGDELRTLPCSHQYHVNCVDKWLKEVHRVCPLCRSNVCESYVDILC